MVCRYAAGILFMTMPDFYPLVRPILRRLPPEAAHMLTLSAIQSGVVRLAVGRNTQADPPTLTQRIWDLEFANPVGLASGFDKNAEVPDAMLDLGFGFVEVGTVTPRAQSGNTKPRLFRLDQDRAVINRMGFNSRGLDEVIARLSRRREAGIVGVNLGVNRGADAVTDYEHGIRRTAHLADYLVVNISSPNTPGLRELQMRTALNPLLRRVIDARDQTGRRVPMLLKIAPDLTSEERNDIAEAALETGIDGLVVANTTVARPSGLRSRYAAEAGGLSGCPLFPSSTALLCDMYRLTHGKLPLIGVGGIASAADAFAKIRAGASLVQLYTALIFEGPALISRIKAGLAELLCRDGFTSIGDAVGSAAISNSATARGSSIAEL
jgi:dihydroorotate dehydrogenase